MSLTAAQLANTTAAAFDVRLQYFALPYQFSAVTDLADFVNGAGLGALPSGWSALGDVITPGGDWTDITARVARDGTFTQEAGRGTVNWQAALRGYDYDATYLRLGNGLCCLRRDVTAADDSDWYLWWVGIIDAGEYQRDYAAGDAWRRTVRDISAVMRTTDAPRLVVGTINVAEGASVTVSSTLATPADEAANGEFVGAAANVGGGNIVDSNKRTLWISQDVPIYLGETPGPVTWPEPVIIDEVFMHPSPGYSLSRSWWVELYNHSDQACNLVGQEYADGPAMNFVPNKFALYCYTGAGKVAMLSFSQPAGILNKGNTYTLEPEERAVICADLRVFESMTGGARNGAKFVIEAKSWGTVEANATTGDVTTTYCAMTPDPEVGWFAFGTVGHQYMTKVFDLICWGDAVGLVPGWLQKVFWDGINYTWITPWVDLVGVDLAGITAGQGIRRRPTGTDTDAAADWAIIDYPRPGAGWEAQTPQWAKLTLAEHASDLAADVAAGAGTLYVNPDTTGWPESGNGLLDFEPFAYTGRTATTLTGVTGLAAAHITGSPLWPLDADGDAMTGWYCSQIEIYRPPDKSQIILGRIYLSAFEARDYEDTGWETDYDPAPIQIVNQIGDLPGWWQWQIQQTFDISERPNRWLRTVLIVIDRMMDGTYADRAKINETILTLDAAAVNDSGAADMGSSTASDVIDYVLDTYNPIGAQLTVTDSTPTGWGVIGRLALAIAPLPGVLADVGEMHGIVVCWRPGGYVELIANPWWPGGRDGASWLYEFGPASVRGEVSFSDTPLGITGVTLSAQGSDGAALAPATALLSGTAADSSVRQVSGYTVASQDAARSLAWNLLWREVGGAWRARWAVKGIGEWCRPYDRYLITWDDDNYGQWLAERVTTSWSPGSWETRIEAVNYAVAG